MLVSNLFPSPPAIKEKTPKVHLYTFGVLVKKYLSVKNKSRPIRRTNELRPELSGRH